MRDPAVHDDSTPHPALAWWQSGVIYQIYPRSFQDADGDGVGDLRGIIARLDYLERLGVNCLWLSPVFLSPMKDFGYDVADYTAIDPLFGTMADFEALLSGVHARGMKLILDLVPNHTSDQHQWFAESRSSRTNPRRDWYVWADPAPDGGPPNNWLSYFGGPAWTLDEATGQYYLHQFVREQPELNYRNPAVLAAMLEQMRFWLDRGVDGFRVDVIWLMIKDATLRDEPLNPAWKTGDEPIGSLLHIYTQDQPEVHELIRAMRALTDRYGTSPESERVLVGEIYLPNRQLMTYYGIVNESGKGDECHLPFNFQLIDAPWDAAVVRAMVDAYEGELPPHGWPNWVLGNHDRRRIASRVGPEQARVAAMLLLTLRGTPTIYYGDEIGMEDVPVPAHRRRDPQALNQPDLAERFGRDPQRSPMLWDASPNAGFTSAAAEPWLPVAADYELRSVAAQENIADSFLNFFRALLRLRSTSAALTAGDYVSIDTGARPVLAYLRRKPRGERLLVVLNFSDRQQQLDLLKSSELKTSAPAFSADLPPTAAPLIDTHAARPEVVTLSALSLAPHQGMILRLGD